MPAPVADELKVRTRDFALILYQEDSKHMKVLDMIKRFPKVYQAVWILHDRDILDDGSLKKPHYHVLCHTKTMYSVSAFLKQFLGYLDYVEPIHVKESYLMYMCHQTLQSLDKTPYNPDELQGDAKIINSVYEQNTHFVQLGEFAEMCQNGFKISNIILDTLSIDDNNKRKVAIDTFKEYSHLIACMSNQELNDLARKRGNSRTSSDVEYYPQVSITD